MTAIPSILPGGPRVTSPGRRFGLQARLTANEASKGVTLIWRRRGRLIPMLIMYSLTYLGFSLLIGGGKLAKPVMVLTFPGLLAMVVASTAALQGSGGIAEEINGGTLEQSQLGPGPQSVHILGRLAAVALDGLFKAVVLGTGLALGIRLSFQLNPAVLITGLLTVADALGYGLVVIALTVRIASIGAVVHVFNAAIMFFGGMIVPVTAFPRVVHAVARFLPTTLGTEATNTILSGHPLSATWSDGSLPLLITHTIVLLAAGWALYIVFIRRARRVGGLSPQ